MRLLVWLMVAAGSLAAASGRAELVEVEVLRREPYAGGKAFGEVGPYEVILGIGRFAVDPGHVRNRGIVDLGLAPRNAQGKVEFRADVHILAPKNLDKGNGAIFYDVNNRGIKLALRFFNDAPGENDLTKADPGNGYLLRRGYTVVWCGWIGELLPGEGRMLLEPPVATKDGKPIRGMVRYEMVTDQPADTLPLSRREGHGSYSPTEKGEAEGVLTWRMRETDPRVAIPRGQWSLERKEVPKNEQGVRGTLGQVRMRLAGGFRPGYIYELICEAEGPIVQGLGYAATRDLLSFLRHDASPRNPLRRGDGRAPFQRAHGFGVSQSGRFLRNFLHLGFNADEQGRKVFDGLIPHVAGGGLGFFNHRFAQPTRHNGQHEEHLFPGDRFPFTYGEATDPFTKKRDSLMARTAKENPDLLPRIMHTQSAAEYWHRSGSLVHTDPEGKKDAEVPANVRIYAFGGTQHGPDTDPPTRGIADSLNNPGDYRPLLRALLDALDAWVARDAAPPPSVYPRLDQKTLTGWSREETGFPALPGVRYPEVIQQPPWADWGPHFETDGIVSINPPRIEGHYPVLVPRSDKDGNDLGTLLPPEVAVPLATYTGWNLRHRSVGAEGMLASLKGSYLPFPATAKDREATGDPRQSLEERYRSFQRYLERLAEKSAAMVRERYLLEEDVATVLERADRRKELFSSPGREK